MLMKKLGLLFMRQIRDTPLS